MSPIARLAFVTALALLAAGCNAISQSREMSIEPGQYRNFHELAVASIKDSLKDNPAPEDVKARFARCASAWESQFIRPDEMARLDAYARGERVLTVGEAQRIMGSSPVRREMTAADLQGLCPDDIASFQAYKLPS